VYLLMSIHAAMVPNAAQKSTGEKWHKLQIASMWRTSNALGIDPFQGTDFATANRQKSGGETGQIKRKPATWPVLWVLLPIGSI
jgi:hypothetical protein